MVNERHYNGIFKDSRREVKKESYIRENIFEIVRIAGYVFLGVTTIYNFFITKPEHKTLAQVMMFLAIVLVFIYNMFIYKKYRDMKRREKENKSIDSN